MFKASEGKLQLVSADGFRLAVVTVDYDDGEGQVLINRDELKGIASALRKTKRVRLGFEKSEDSLDGMSLVIDTEAIRYKWRGVDGDFPKYEQVIPTGFNTTAHLDTVEASKAVASLKALSDSTKDYPTDLTIGEGKIVMANPDEKGEAIIPADTDGQGYVRIDGKYLAQALKACGGMVYFKLTNAYSPMLFTADSYQVVVMPMMSTKAEEQAKQDMEARQAQAKVEPSREAAAQAVAEAEAVLKGKAKAKRRCKREPVAVA